MEILGQGGMGSIYRAIDERLGVEVAVKENFFITEEYARQFRLEAVILASLRHPNLPRVSDHFIEENGQYLVMDYIEGEDLRQRMERLGTITEEEAVMIGAAVCDALTYLHTRKPPILHRDIKPGNIKITPDGHIFLVDFGLAKVVEGSQATSTGARAMTPGYSPPEQYGTARTDARTDIYSLGATLYAALTGVIPEDGLARAMGNTDLTPLRKRNPKVSRRLAAVIEKAMEIDPAQRYQTAEEFKRALLAAKGVSERETGTYTVAPPAQPAPTPSEAIAQEASSASASSTPGGKSPIPVPVMEEDQPFRPPKRKRRGWGCFTWILLVGLLLFGAGFWGVYAYPQQARQLAASLPFSVFPLPSSATPTFPANGAGATPAFSSETPFPSSTEGTLPPLSTPVATLTPTPTATPLPPTFTPSPSPTPTETPLGGGYGQIAFASMRLQDLPQIFIMNFDGSDVRQLTNLPEGACQPEFAPDGTRLVFISPCKAPQEKYPGAALYMMNADGSGLMVLTNVPGGDFDPAWSPSGRKIAFTSLRQGKSDLYILDLGDNSVTPLNVLERGDTEASQPTWSPDGKWLAFTRQRFGSYQIWKINLETGEKEQLTRSGPDYKDFSPVWSPDGMYLLFSQRLIGQPIVRARLIPLDSGTLSYANFGIISPVEGISFSADGFWVVFESVDEKGNRDIYRALATGGGLVRLTSEPGSDFDPAWRPLSLP
uniref:Serine/threonine protein kinase n=1 Tax=uncultured Chloroflexota bacterium TaxID=166587 RepID=H5SK99_9CHLR|nr:serine/threonine protein kinase [uncultured bacterium]BAL56585.1 serine/threonine protein kinase [uncultured Chloroflexota bacterium]